MENNLFYHKTRRHHAAKIVITVAGVLVFLFGRSPTTSGAATTLTFSPSSSTVTVGATFSVRALVNAGQAINAAEATISFPNDLLQVTSLSRASSIFSLWAVDPAYSNSAGTITFSGGLPSPGFAKSGGTIVTIVFRAKAAGSAKLTFTGAQVTANDGEGTDVLSGTGSANYTVRAAEAPPPPPPEQPSFPAPTISSSTHPDQNRWYALVDVRGQWSAGTGVKGYNAVFDQSPATTPPETDEGNANSFLRTGLADGTWYIHVRAHYASGWSVVRHFAYHIDTTPPASFTIDVSHSSETDQNATLTFSTTDATAGIDRYELKKDGEDFRAATSPQKIEHLTAGSHTFTVRAFDKAGNTREATASIDISGPTTPTAMLANVPSRILGEKGGTILLVAGTPMQLRGFAKRTDTIHIVVRSAESVFDFPVDAIIDPSPIETAPSGLTAWKVEISPDLTPGDHEIHVTAVDAAGVASAEAPVIRFRVVTNVVRVGATYLPLQSLLVILFAAVGILFALFAVVLVLYLRLRRATSLAVKKHPPKKKSKP